MIFDFDPEKMAPRIEVHGDYVQQKNETIHGDKKEIAGNEYNSTTSNNLRIKDSVIRAPIDIGRSDGVSDDIKITDSVVREPIRSGSGSYCMNCGSMSYGNSKFCRNCGEKL